MVEGTRGQRTSAMLEAVLGFAALGFATLVLLGLSSGLAGERLQVLADPIGWLSSLDSSAAFDTVSNAAEVIAGVLGVAITVVAIVLELAATRYSHRITWLFVREPVNIAVLSLFVLTTLQCVWVAATLSGTRVGEAAEAIVPSAGFVITLGMVTVSLLALLPYFNFVFAFLSPINMIAKIESGAIRRIRRLRAGRIESIQASVEEAVDELQEVARSASEQGDRSIAMATVEAFANLITVYSEMVDDLPEAWFRIGPSVAADPDFVSLSPAAHAEIERSGTWLEVKVMEQYLALMALCVPRERDVANLIAIMTNRLATGPGRDRPALRSLLLRCMNSYLRTSINAGDARTTYYVMNQYRLIAEAMLETDHSDDAIEIAERLKFYGNLGYETGMPFLLETAAHDLVELIEADVAKSGRLTDRLLDVLLDLDRETREEHEEKTLLGVRRSQMQLGTLFLHLGQDGRAERVVADLAGESPDRIERVRNVIEHAVDPEYWEFTARGVNFAYLDPERRDLLPELLRRVEAIRAAGPGSS